MSINLFRFRVLSLLLVLIPSNFAHASEIASSDSKTRQLLAFDSPQQHPPIGDAAAQGALLSNGEPRLLSIRKSDGGAFDLFGAAPGGSEWIQLGVVPAPDAVFRSKSTPEEWLLISTDSGRSLATSIYRIFSDNADGIGIAELPAPPSIRDPSIARMGGVLYLVGLEDKELPSVRLYQLDLSAKDPDWKRMKGVPDRAGDSVVIHVVHQGLLLFGEGAEERWGYVYSRLGGWTELDKPPSGLAAAEGVPCGESNLLFFGLLDDPELVLMYNATLDRWVGLPEAPQTFKIQAAMQTGGTDFLLIGETATIAGRAVLQGTNYGWVDHGVVFVFMAVMLWIGFRLSKRENSNQDYFRGGRRVPFWASGMSLFATGASAISLMAMPGMAFATDWTYMSISFYIMISTLVVLFVYVPLARRLDVATANEYLERRYGLTLRLIGSVIYSLNQILARLAAIMLLPAIALSAIIGMPMETSILIMGLVTTAYATMGGLEGVIWTDVIQAFVMILAVLLCSAWALTALEMSFDSAFASLQSLEKLNLFNPSFGLLGPTLFVLFINAFVTVLGMIGDQNFIQRVQCTPSERDAKKAVITQILVAVPLNLILFSLGTILFLFYLERPDMLNPTIKADGIFPVFAAQNLPPRPGGGGHRRTLCRNHVDPFQCHQQHCKYRRGRLFSPPAPHTALRQSLPATRESADTGTGTSGNRHRSLAGQFRAALGLGLSHDADRDDPRPHHGVLSSRHLYSAGS